MKILIRLSLLTALLVATLGYSILPASANSKEVTRYEFTAVNDVTVCSNGQILVEDLDIIWYATIWRNNDGEFFMLEEEVDQYGKVYLKDEPGKFLNYEGSHWKNFTKPTGIMQSSGILMKMVIPGYGNIWQDIGHFVFAIDPVKGIMPVKLDGQHEFMLMDGYPNTWNYTPACDYLTSLP